MAESCSTLSRCFIFWQIMSLCVCVFKVSHLLSVHCQDALSFGRSCHFVCVCVCVQSYCALKVSHLSSVHCQDASSFGRSCHFVCVCTIISCCQGVIEYISYFIYTYISVILDRLLLIACILSAEVVHRYYESRRRLFNDDQPGRRDAATKAK